MVESESEPGEKPFYGPAKGGWVTLTNPAPRARQQVERRPCAVSVPAKLVHHRFNYVPPKSRDKPREPFQTPPDELVTARDNASDRWHVDRVVSVPRPTPLQVITIPFRPTHGPCTAGVSLSELLVCRGLTDPWKRLSAHIPNGLLVEPPGRMGRLVITWPDYPNTQLFELLSLKDNAGHYSSRAELAKDVANAFKKFIQKCEGEYVVPTGRRGWRLGKGGISFGQLRLLEVCSGDGKDFHARLGVVPPRLGTVVFSDAIVLS